MVGPRIGLGLPFVLGLLVAPITAQETQRVSVATGGTQGNSFSEPDPAASISADGRIIVFSSFSDFVPGDTNLFYDIYVRNRQDGTTRLASVSPSGSAGDGHSLHAAVSADGRYVAFDSSAINLANGDGFAGPDVFVHDLQTGTTAYVTYGSGGSKGGARPAISANGRLVAFESTSSAYVAGDTNGFTDIFVRDRVNGMIQRVSVATGGAQGDEASYSPSISADGRYVAFLSLTNNLVAGDTNTEEDVFVHDRQTGVTELVNRSSSGVQGNTTLDTQGPRPTPALSADGRYVAFVSNASTLVPGDTNGARDVFVRDRQLGTTERVNVGWNGAQGQGSAVEAWMSADGRFVAFTDLAALVPGDTNGLSDVYVRDRVLGTTERASIATGGTQGDADSRAVSLSADGRFVVFEGASTNLVAGDTNAVDDVFLRDRKDTSAFTSFCDPGSGGIVGCPCSNPAAGPGRGCDNHGSMTGGAALYGSGNPSLASDSVLLGSGQENSTALTIFWSGPTQLSPPGTWHGAGVRCVTVLKRLYHGNAMGGFISRPAPGDASVSARSAAVGDTIVPGVVRHYFTVYRDPQATVPCSNPASGINLSNAVSVQWGP